ncbi:hypothetical protein BN2475_530024 [Paraburkholderia ribeironis]|uniref:Uncharacterized protein n=1 Tax=Paraburkholderia ribeironis TaxID=1247936 RepID=A0A1N7SCR8_9BURK|nr:hypothetical protein [Paraburkholderia ribeironis]SIT45124.1 hypothetical protein BN2475_530024 [Paraburkholderia ribeironis]
MALALSLSLIKRVPDVALGLPGLLAWHLTETRHLLSTRRAASVPADETASDVLPQVRSAEKQPTESSMDSQVKPDVTVPLPPDRTSENSTRSTRGTSGTRSNRRAE